MAQKKKMNTGYSEEFQAMLDRLQKEDEAYEEEEEDTMMSNNNGYYSHSNMMMRKNRLSDQQVKALEIYFEEDNKLQPERKLKIAEELGLEPRQVAVWFQNRRARWKAKQIEKEYDQLRASYDALKHQYGSLQHERSCLLTQLIDLKAKIEAKTLKNNTTLSVSTQLNPIDVMNEGCCQNMSLATSSSSTPHQEVFDPPSSSSALNGYRLLKAYQNQLARMEDLGMSNNEELCNFFSIDHAPTLHWQQGDKFN